MAETVNGKVAVLTEEMIDAAMSKRLKDMSEEQALISQEKVRNDHNYCEEDYSSDSDYEVESIDGSSGDSEEESTSVNNRIDCKITSDTYGGAIQNGDAEEENLTRISLNSSTVSDKSSDNKITSVNVETANSKVESGVKKGLIIKPLTNLLKADLIQPGKVKSKNLRIFKCVNGKIQLVPDSEISPAEKQKYLMYKNRFQTTKIASNIPSTHLENMLSNELYRSRRRSSSEESQCESLNNDYESPNDFNSQTCSAAENKLTVIKTKNNEGSDDNSLFKDMTATASVNISTVDGCTLEKSPKTNSLLKTSITKLNNIIEDNILNEESLPKLTDKLSLVKDTTTKNFNKPLDNKNKQTDGVIDCETSTNSGDDNEMTIEPVTESNDNVTFISANVQNTYSRLNTSRKLVKVQSKPPPFVCRKQVLPKINYRYHTKDKLIIADKLPNSTTTVISVNNKKPNNNSNFYKMGSDNSNTTKNIVIMAPDGTKSQQKATTQSVIRLKSPPGSTNSPKYLRNVINSVITPANSATVSKSSSSTVPSKVLIRDKNCVLTSSNRSNVGSNNTENWEKLDRFELNNERYKGESGLNTLKTLILEREVPVYKPIETNEFYPCLECGDRFVLESSLREHKLRKSVLIIYWCRTCSCCLNLYNRCMFLSHIRSHNQSFKNLDMSCLSIEPIPKHLLLRSNSDVEPSPAGDKPSSSSANNIPVSDSTTITSSSVLMSSASTGTSESSQQASIGVVSTVSSVGNSSNNSKNHITGCDTVPKSIQAERRAINTAEISRNSNSNNEDDIVILNEDGISDNTSSAEKTKDGSLLEDDMEITVSNITSEDVAEKQYSTIVSTTENVDSELNPKKQVKGRRKCPECGILITAKCSLRKHLQNFNKPLSDKLKCEKCQLILQSQCALKMHLRIHLKTKPFRCPECAIEFTLFDRFMMHLKYTCCHMTKVVKYVCSVCSSMQTSAEILEQHLLSRHVRSIYKCGSCPVAFISLKSADRHKEKEHPGRIVTTQSYQQCKLCPEKLIPKKRFLLHMKNHLNDEKVRVYAFQCPTCKFTFFHRTELVYHRMKCDSRDGIIRSVLDTAQRPEMHLESSTLSTVKNTKNGEVELEFVTPGKKRKLSQDDEIELIQEEEKDPLSLEDFQVEETIQEPVEETCVVCKTEKVLILPGKDQSSQSLCCKKCVSPCGVIPQRSNSVQRNKLMAAKLKGYKCKICNSTNFMDLKSIFLHFKSYHTELEGQSINEWLIIDNSVIVSKKSNTVTTAETIKEKYKKKRASVLNTFNQVAQEKQEPSTDADDHHKEYTPPEKKKPKKCIKPKQKVISDGKQFESGQIIVPEESEKAEFSCSMCDFVGVNKEELRDHVISHRSDPNALQCLECGECFVVLPSLEKHLIISHRIKDVDKYIADNKQCMPSSSNEEELTNGVVNDDSELSKTCKVCYEAFESKNALDKHFRSHGMAFLFKKQ